MKGMPWSRWLDGSDLTGMGDGVPAVHNFQSHLQASGIEQNRFSVKLK
jgi:hypothetical protein